MSAGSTVRPDVAASPPGRRLPTAARIAIGVAAALAILVGFALFTGLSNVARPIPEFPSLAANPDPSLHGTVAYFSDSDGCVRIVATAGAPSKDVLCLPDQDAAQAKTLGKLIGPQLVWLPDNRLEVTMFRMTEPPGPDLNPGWQKIVDVRTGSVEDVPDAKVPSETNTSAESAVNPDGDRLVTSSDPESGRVTITLQKADGSERTLLEAQGPAPYGYDLHTAFWSPDWEWVAADDGRILIVTLDDPPVTRVLTDQTTAVPFDQARFAITAEDIFEQ